MFTKQELVHATAGSALILAWNLAAQPHPSPPAIQQPISNSIRDASGDSFVRVILVVAPKPKLMGGSSGAGVAQHHPQARNNVQCHGTWENKRHASGGPAALHLACKIPQWPWRRGGNLQPQCLAMLRICKGFSPIDPLQSFRANPLSRIKDGLSCACLWARRVFTKYCLRSPQSIVNVGALSLHRQLVQDLDHLVAKR